MTVAEDPVAVHVPLGARAYEVRIGAGLIRRAGAEIAPLLIRPRLAVVTDDAHVPMMAATLSTSISLRAARTPASGLV